MTLAAILVFGIMCMCVGGVACALLYVKLSENNRVSPI
jgi:hypothetical protein|tara:strand:+ start:1156 stop:1269 length:114 start_codon:yes stop_codon:yes gene_type:complete